MSGVTASAERERSSRVLQGGRVVLMSGTYRFLYTYNTSRTIVGRWSRAQLNVRIRKTLSITSAVPDVDALSAMNGSFFVH